MPRRATIGFCAVLAAGLVVLVAAGFATRSRLVYTPGVTPLAPAVTLEPRDQACILPVSPPDGSAFEQVRVFAGERGRPGPALEATVTTFEGRRELGRGRVQGGYVAGERAAPLVIPVGRVEPDEAVRVCVRDVGDEPAQLWGATTIASKSDTSLNGGPQQGNDIAVRLERRDERSLFAWLPAVAERASLFKARILSPGLLLAVALVLLVGGPLLLVRALRGATG